MPKMKPASKKFLDSLNTLGCDDLGPVKNRKSSRSDKMMFFGRLCIVLILAVTFVASGVHVTSNFIDLHFNYENWGDILGHGIVPTLGGRFSRTSALPNFNSMLDGGYDEDIPPDERDIDRFTINLARIASATHINRNTPGTVLGWITIYTPCRTRTIIDYPIVQGRDNDFYLHHLLDGRRSGVGSIFLDYRANREVMTPHQNFVIYGHNVGVGGSRKFHSLHRLHDSQRFFNDHPIVTIYTTTGFYEFTIFGVARVHEAGGHNRVNFNSTQQYLEFMQYIQRNSRFRRSGITLDANSRLLSLSTCTNGPRHERLHVAAVMTNHVSFG